MQHYCISPVIALNIHMAWYPAKPKLGNQLTRHNRKKAIKNETKALNLFFKIYFQINMF